MSDITTTEDPIPGMRRAALLRYAATNIVPLPRSRRVRYHVYIDKMFYASFSDKDVALEAIELWRAYWPAVRGKRLHLVTTPGPN